MVGLVQLLMDQGVFDTGFKFRAMVLPDDFINQASPKDMYDTAGMNAAQIAAKARELLDIAE